MHSFQVHCGVDQMFILAGVRQRKISTNEDDTMDIEALKAAIETDKARGLFPTIVLLHTMFYLTLIGVSNNFYY